MENLTDDQRKLKTDEITAKISALSKEKTMNYHSIRFFKSHIQKDLDQETETEIKLTEINNKLIDLYAELRKYQILYFVEYVFEHTIYNSTRYWETKREYLHFNTNCQIDTSSEEGWTQYANNTDVDKLLKEIDSYIVHSNFSNYKIRQIRRE